MKYQTAIVCLIAAQNWCLKCWIGIFYLPDLKIQRTWYERKTNDIGNPERCGVQAAKPKTLGVDDKEIDDQRCEQPVFPNIRKS